MSYIKFYSSIETGKYKRLIKPIPEATFIRKVLNRQYEIKQHKEYSEILGQEMTAQCAYVDGQMIFACLTTDGKRIEIMQKQNKRIESLEIHISKQDLNEELVDRLEKTIK